MRIRPPSIDGLHASAWQLPPGPWLTVLDGLCDRFPAIKRDQWQERMVRGRVLHADGSHITSDTAYRVGLEVYYYREVADEPAIPFREAILHVDTDLLVVDKPHFLPVIPAGEHAHETLLARLICHTGNEDLVALHRIDRETAGLVMFSTNPGTRQHYQRLFAERRIVKRYEAVAPALAQRAFPFTHRSRMVAGEPFFRMREVAGAPNSETHVELIERTSGHWRYALFPVTGRKHQLRLHMASLGAPILNDSMYPVVARRAAGDYSSPLQLLAKALTFVDPLSGDTRSFSSLRELSGLA